jgi:hypothetical protein
VVLNESPIIIIFTICFHLYQAKNGNGMIGQQRSTLKIQKPPATLI